MNIKEPTAIAEISALLDTRGAQTLDGQKFPSIDMLYGPYASKQEAWTALSTPNDSGLTALVIGKTVGIIEDGTIVEYWFESACSSIDDLVKKAAEASIETEEDDLNLEGGTLRLADRGSLNGMGYVILRTEKSFAQQVTKANTIYEIRYDYDLGGNSVTIPANCLLKFNGGSLTNGTLVGNQTDIEYAGSNMILDVCLSGTWNTEFYSCWLTTDAADLTMTIGAIFSDNDNILTLNSDITTNAASIVCKNVAIIGNGYTWDAPPQFAVSGNISVENVSFTNCSGYVFSPYRNDASLPYSPAVVTFRNVIADGDGTATAFYYNNTKDKTTVYYGQDVTFVMSSCQINAFTTYGVRLSCKVHDSEISFNTFTEIGEVGANHGAVAVYVGEDLKQSDGIYTATNVRIADNTFGIVAGYYQAQGDVREIHAVLVYGEYCNVLRNTCFGVSTNFSTIVDTGQDAEAIYLKARYSSANENYIESGSGSASDGAISFKGKNVDNVIANNIIKALPYGRAILGLTGESISITGNSITTSGTTFGIQVQNIEKITLDGNTIEVNNTNYAARTGVYISTCEDLTIQGNKIKNSIPSMHIVDAAGKISKNAIEIDNPNNVTTSSNIVHVIRLEGDSVSTTIFEDNRISINKLPTAWAYVQNASFINNVCNILDCTANFHILPYYEAIVSDNTFSLNTAIPLLRSESAGSTTVKGNMFTDTMPEIFGRSIEGNNFRNRVSSVMPSNPTTGTHFFNSGLGVPMWYDGSRWRSLLYSSAILRETTQYVLLCPYEAKKGYAGTLYLCGLLSSIGVESNLVNTRFDIVISTSFNGGALSTYTENICRQIGGLMELGTLLIDETTYWAVKILMPQYRGAQLTIDTKYTDIENTVIEDSLSVTFTPLSTYLVKGATTARPSNVEQGFEYYDITLNKPIWWNGTAWIDSTGADPDA